jgi:hypothetical protein
MMTLLLMARDTIAHDSGQSWSIVARSPLEGEHAPLAAR